jgi:DNA (cytosine-5)-methyltransferase 1
MTRPRLLDLFCGGGGAGEGYRRAGFDVTGVDIAEQPHYPFRFIRADALTFPLDEFDAIHASASCQRWARVTAWRGNPQNHPDVLTPMLARLAATTVPWIVENVPESGIRPDYLLCGTQFGLPIRRHRAFQCDNWSGYELLPPHDCYRNPRLLAFEHKNERAFADAMGCTWMNNKEARQAIPPAYTEFIGRDLINYISAGGTRPLADSTEGNAA